MKTSPLSKVSASVPVSKKSKFNLSHDVNTTYDFGSVQPLFSKLMLPDSSINVNNEQLTRLAPMVVPTFGRVKIKNVAHFVPCEEIFPNWDAMMSQTKVTRPNMTSNGQVSSVTYVPRNVPYINNNILAAFCLAGSKVNIYFSGTVGTAAENSWTCPYNGGAWASPTWSVGTVAARAYLNGLLDIVSSDSPSTSNMTSTWNYVGYIMGLRKIVTDKSGSPLFVGTGNAYQTLNVPTISTMSCQPMANANGEGYTHSASNEMNKYTLSTVNEAITFDGADLIWEYAGSNPASGISSADRASGSGTPVEGITNTFADGCKVRLVFKLSSYGKRMRKILIGLGYDMNLANDDLVSFLPLIAFYKAWWDTYAPERFKNFYETNAWKIVNSCMADALSCDMLTTLNSNNATGFRTYFRSFMAELGCCFATDKMDVISAATDNYYGASNTTQNSFGYTDIQATVMDTIRQVLGNTNPGPDGSSNTAFYPGNTNASTGSEESSVRLDLISPASLTQPQIDMLKKSYIMLNKTSVAGMKVEEILRALGHGDYVEECKGKFISSTDDMVKISDVVATAATDDAQLGQYGGRGIGFGKFQFSFSTGRYGYLVVLSAIVPEAGYVNSPVHENEAISFDTMYQPEFDGLAYEALQKKQITGSPLVSDASYAETFGFLPTYSQWKFMSNKANGDFSLNSRKASYLPYTLDKYIPVANANTYGIVDDANHAGTKITLCSPTFKYSDLPNAGEDYRYVNKFPWNGNFNRIFSQQGDGLEWSVYSPNNNAFLYNSFEYDNFLCHNVFQVSYFAHMKSIEDSYGTYDEEHGAPNTSVTRS